MKRLFWVAVGAGAAIVVARRVGVLRERYSPPAVVDRAVKGASAQATTVIGRVREAAAAFGSDLAEARDRREAELHAALAAEGRAPADRTDARGQARHLREQARSAARWDAERVDPQTSGGDYPGRTTRVDDEDDLPYSF
ncbi:hypothetical protein ACTVCO_09360 [Sanguibacter sp. A247]|uniref:hypothetical protein n=1 Tax=unclassified Sanguibacter TaxID=2645534 RepID=UPI003FD87639